MIKKCFLKCLLLTFILTITLMLTSCISTVTNVVLNNETTTFEINSFTIEKLELRVFYDNEVEEYNIIKVKETMVSKEDLAKLTTLGTHTITINYEGYQLKDVEITLEQNTDFLVEEVKLSVNDAYYEVEALSNKYVATCTHDAQYVYVIIKVVLNTDYYFSEEGISLYVNDELIDSSLYTITNNTLEYKYEDPNWSDIF